MKQSALSPNPNSPSRRAGGGGNKASEHYSQVAAFLEVDPPRQTDEGLDPMAGFLEDLQPGQMQPRNMSSWVARGTAAILGGVYHTQDALEASRELASAMMKNACVQTEPPQMKDASAMIIDGEMESERLNNLDIGLPLPVELPVLTTSQLLEMERRLGDLMSRLEDEIQRAENEVQRRREQDAVMERRAEVMQSNRFGKWTTNTEWIGNMRNRIEQRLHARHGFGEVPALPTQKLNLDSTMLSPLQGKRAKLLNKKRRLMEKGLFEQADMIDLGDDGDDEEFTPQDEYLQQGGVGRGNNTSGSPFSNTSTAAGSPYSTGGGGGGGPFSLDPSQQRQQPLSHGGEAGGGNQQQLSIPVPDEGAYAGSVIPQATVDPNLVMQQGGGGSFGNSSFGNSSFGKASTGVTAPTLG